MLILILNWILNDEQFIDKKINNWKLKYKYEYEYE